MSDNDQMLEFQGELKHETDKAWLFWVADTEEEVWFPKSRCNLHTDFIECPLWLARQKDLA